MSGNRLEIRPIKSLALKNTILAKIAIKIKTKQLNWEFWDKHNNENTKIWAREYRSPNVAQILRDRVLATWRLRGKANRSKSARLHFVRKINVLIIFPWSVSIFLHFDMPIQHLRCFPRQFQLDVDDALRKWIYKERTDHRIGKRSNDFSIWSVRALVEVMLLQFFSCCFASRLRFAKTKTIKTPNDGNDSHGERYPCAVMNIT